MERPLYAVLRDGSAIPGLDAFKTRASARNYVASRMGARDWPTADQCNITGPDGRHYRYDVVRIDPVDPRSEG